MAVFLSPGVFSREVDLSILPSNTGALVPAFIGTAQKGPVNVPTLITSAVQFVEVFGNPFPESYLGYAVMAFMEEGTQCYVLRVGVEYQLGMDSDLEAIAIDTSGAKVQGWGRIPVYQGIDHGIIKFRAVSPSIVIHTASATAGSWQSAVETDTDTGTETSDVSVSITAHAYTGCLDSTYTLTITGDPTGTSPIAGATYVVTDSSGVEAASGTLTAVGSASSNISFLGITLHLVVNSGDIGINDQVTISAVPDNTTAVVTVENVAKTLSLTPGTYTTAAAFVTAIGSAITTAGGASFSGVVTTNDNGDTVPAIRTTTEGRWLQITGTCAFCAEVGIPQYTYDIPRSHLLGAEVGPYTITTANNRVVLDVIGATETMHFDFNLPSAATTATAIAAIINANDGVQYFESFALTAPGGLSYVAIVTTTTAELCQLKLQATYSYVTCLRFAEEVGISYPYASTYRTYWDARVTLPASDPSNPSAPLSGSALDIDYFADIVGWFVAKYPGTWIDNYTLSIELFTEGVGDVAGRFKITVRDASGVAQDVIQDITFDPADTRYIGNVVNAGSPIGGVNGNMWYQWEARPDYVGTDDRVPSPFVNKAFIGSANGIPTEPEDSIELDRVVIGNPALSTGIYAFQNPEAYDFNLLLIPGFASGPVIAQAIQFCENRGDVLYLVDPPIGLRPQQAIDWHNGMLTSDLVSALNTSFGALYWGWLKVNDQFNGGTIWVPPCGHIAAVFARTDRVAEQWFAPAGLNRGKLSSAIDVEYNPTQGERDALYGSGNAVNPIVNFTNQGIVVWGQRTLQRRSSALDRVNVRMLLIFLKKNLGRTLRSFVFEQNDAATRSQVRNTVDPFLGDIAARRGITAWVTVCNETNNTPERIDRHELWVSVFIKPESCAEHICLNLVTLRTGANFSAQEVLAAGGVVNG